MKPRRNAYFLLLLAILALACNRGAGKKESGDVVDGEWYRRYSGTLAGKPVVVQLHHFDDRMAGSYFTPDGAIRDLEDADDDAEGYDYFLNDYERANHTDRFTPDTDRPCRWALNFRGNTIMGKQVSVDEKTVNGIDLTEAYPEGSYRLRVFLHGDSMQEKKGFTNTKAISYYQLLTPPPQMDTGAARWLLATELQLLGGDTLGATDLVQYTRKEDHKYFTKYKQLLKDLVVDADGGHKHDWEYNYIHSRNVFVLYNDGGLLSLGVYDYDYSGGGSGFGLYLGNYAVLDMKERRVWQLKDMISLDETRLLPLLDRETRKIFRLGPHDNLSKTLSVDAVPLSENVFVNGSGITFCYPPTMIGNEVDGEICVFLPYSELSALLKPEFKKRMGL